MKTICSWCTIEINAGGENSDGLISHGICEACAFHLRASHGMAFETYIRGLQVPVAVVNDDSTVLFVSGMLKKMLAKDDVQIAGFPGGVVFECEYAYLPGGCGGTVHCDGCTIRNTVMDTHRDGLPRSRVNANLRQRTADGGSQNLALIISTEKVDDVVVLLIENPPVVELS